VGLSTLLDPEAIAACVATNVRERAPRADVSYVAFADPSGGRHDRFTLAIAHREHDQALLDLIRAWAPPFNPSGVIAEAATLLKQYGVTRVESDRYSAEFAAEAFRANGIEHRAADRDRSGLYLELLPLVNSARAVLLDDPELLRELRGLERRRGHSGRDRVDHRAGASDDRANAAAGALVRAAERGTPFKYWVCGENLETRSVDAIQADHDAEQKQAVETAAQWLKDELAAGGNIWFPRG
jgi:hypothetical protein